MNRTRDLLITNQLLYLLSYSGNVIVIYNLLALRLSVRLRTMYMRVNATNEIPAVRIVDNIKGSVTPHFVIANHV